MKPVLPLGTGRLRPARAADAVFVRALLAAPRVRRYLCDDRILTQADVAALLADSRRRDADGLGLWIVETADRACAGLIGLMPVSGHLQRIPEMTGGVEPLVALEPGYWGQGLARRAMRAMIAHARNILSLPRLVAAVDTPNERSHRLLRATGFEVVGSARGKAHALLLYTLTFNRPLAI